MKKKIRAVSIIISLMLTMAGVCGCGNKAASIEESVDVDNAELLQEAEEKKYAPLYIAKIEELRSSGMADQFALPDIDSDGTPELIASDTAGSYDHDNAFIYTAYKGEAVLLASGITGVDGTSLSYSEGKNIIRISGGMAGMKDVFYEIRDGELAEVLKTEMINTLETDADGDEIYKYRIDGNEVEEAAYYKKLNDFISAYLPLVRIDQDGLNKLSYTYEDGYASFEPTGTDSYSSSQEILGILQGMEP